MSSLIFIMRPLEQDDECNLPDPKDVRFNKYYGPELSLRGKLTGAASKITAKAKESDKITVRIR